MVKKQTIPFQKTGYFSKIICDYLDKNPLLSDFYNQYPNIDGFQNQIDMKRLSFSAESRNILVEELGNQYGNLNTSDKTKQNIQSLLNENTFTITTGHQLNLFTGPLYFLYKIISTINLTKVLKKEFPKYNFVPIYWMATEDHDFEEIQFFNFNDNKIDWKKETSGAVGRLSTQGLDQVFDNFSKQLGNNKNAIEIKRIFQNSYIEHDNLTDATRYLANELFGDYGLVILDADKKELKREFIPFVKDELINQTCFNEVTETNKQLSKNYKVQVNPREINLFYLDKNIRERLVFEDGIYKINNSNLSFTQNEIIQEVENYPEKFSPNVLMRPLYQEVILPNLCYIGGGGELAYWLELNNYFEKVKIPFPILLLRNSALLVTKKQIDKMNKLNISIEDIFLKQSLLINKKVRDISDIEIDFSNQRSLLKKMFSDLEELSNCTDKSFLGAVKAQEKKQLNGIDKLEKRLLMAQKRKLREIVDRITILQNEIFPKNSLQERYANFSEFYLSYGKELIPTLFDALQPLEQEFDIIEL